MFGEIHQQPNRVGFEQVMSLGALYPLEDKLVKIKTPNANAAAKDLVGEEETTSAHAQCTTWSHSEGVYGKE